MKRILFVFTVILTAWQFAYAQIALTGKVYDIEKHTPLPSIKVQNTRTKDNTMTNAAGIFSLQAKSGDVLVLSGFSFETDTILVTNARYIEVTMKLGTKPLDEVKIQNTTTKLGNLKDPSLTGKSLTTQKNEFGDEMGGVALRFGYGKSSKEKHEELLAYNTAATQQIDKVFGTDNLTKYVPLKGEELKQFAGLYRPTIKQYKTPGFDLPSYLNDCYKKFEILTPDQRKLPVLKAELVKTKKAVN
jgi:hypothetical protein